MASASVCSMRGDAQFRGRAAYPLGQVSVKLFHISLSVCLAHFPSRPFQEFLTAEAVIKVEKEANGEWRQVLESPQWACCCQFVVEANATMNDAGEVCLSRP